jgi:battenin
VNVFYRVNQEPADPRVIDAEVAKQEKEFKIGSIGFADSSGILVATLVAVPVELMLCNAQVNRGKSLCKTL